MFVYHLLSDFTKAVQYRQFIWSILLLQTDVYMCIILEKSNLLNRVVAVFDLLFMRFKLWKYKMWK